MYRKILVTFLKAIVLADVVQVITAYHNCSLHFHLHHYACQDSSTNAHVASKWTFLVNVVTLRCLDKFKTQKECNEVLGIYFKMAYSLEFCTGPVFQYRSRPVPANICPRPVPLPLS